MRANETAARIGVACMELLAASVYERTNDKIGEG